MARSAAFVYALIAVLGPLGSPAVAADDVAIAYQRIEPALVKVWAFDGLGNPTQTGSGFIVSSSVGTSYVVTAAHVIADSSKVSVDISRRIKDVPAKIVARTDNPDVALLEIEQGGLTSVSFAARGHVLRVGTEVALAGYFKSDEQIGVTGQTPRLRYPATVGSVAEDGKSIELGLSAEEGLSGAPVFEASRGSVIGMVQMRASAAEASYAISSDVILQFLQSQNIAFALESEHAPAKSVQADLADDSQRAGSTSTTNATGGQSEYQHVLRGLGASDVATQLMTLDQALRNDDQSIRQLAINTAIISSKPIVRSAALRAAIGSAPSFSVSVGKRTTPPVNCPFYTCKALADAVTALGSFTIYVRQFDRTTGSFQSFSDYSAKRGSSDHSLVLSNGNVVGDRVSFGAHFDQRPENYYGGNAWEYQFDCHGTARLKAGEPTLFGTMNCVGGGLTEVFEIDVQIAG